MITERSWQKHFGKAVVLFTDDAHRELVSLMAKSAGGPDDAGAGRCRRVQAGWYLEIGDEG
ncbi:hypothetical protein E4U41_002190 [Claviceps citrina]|nr:hypothetical protein E4U41_002190 [Claviceps citrina]